MNTNEILKKVKKIEIKTKGLSNHIFAGEYNTAFKGSGMTFSEVRGYQQGDDIRSIDWNVTARYNSPFVKLFEEEREMTVFLLIDISASNNFGSVSQFKNELIAEISAILAFSAIKNNDKVGVMFFTDIVEKYIPPKKGKKHILNIIKEILSFIPKKNNTNINNALENFNHLIKKRSICFIVSDFISDLNDKSFKIARKKHDLICLKIFDPREMKLPNIGIVKLLDAESKKHVLIDTSNKRTRQNFEQNILEKDTFNQVFFKKKGIDLIKLSTSSNYIKPLTNFFKKRSKRK